MKPIDVPFDQAGQISPEACYAHIKRLFRAHKGADGIYIQGGAWRTERSVQMLEQDLQVPVVHANLAQVWEIQKRLLVNQPLRLWPAAAGAAFPSLDRPMGRAEEDFSLRALQCTNRVSAGTRWPRPPPSG